MAARACFCAAPRCAHRPPACRVPLAAPAACDRRWRLVAVPCGVHADPGLCTCRRPLLTSPLAHALLLSCVQGIVSQLPNDTAITPGNTDLITKICFQYCALSGGVTGGDGSAPPPPALPVGGTGGGVNGTAPGAESCGNSTVGVFGPVLC